MNGKAKRRFSSFFPLLLIIGLQGHSNYVLGIFDIVGYQHKACTDSFFGTNARALEEEVLKKVDSYVKMLQESAAQCEDEGVMCFKMCCI